MAQKLSVAQTPSVAKTLLPHLTRANVATAYNADYIETLYQQWQQDPNSLEESWQAFFQGFELSMCPRSCVAADRASKQSQVNSLIYAYRSRGHLLAQLDPLGSVRENVPELQLEAFDLTEQDLQTVFDTGHLGGPKRATLEDIIAILRQTYCGCIGVEYIHIQDVKIRRWLQQQMEPIRNRSEYNTEQRREILELLTDAELFETFIHSRYRGQKRFSLEGAETLIPAVHSIVELAPELGVQEIVVGMAHRGRLNVLANILDKSYEEIFSEFEDNFLPDTVAGNSDVKYHRGFASDHCNHQGRNVHLVLASNPSHLEAVDPVVQGRARAKQRQRGDTEQRNSVLPLLIHGDAAFAGQGIVAETLNLSQLKGYHVGGTLHIIVNNQIGFTTLPSESRSTVYATDVAKMVEAPIFHVNGDNPEATCLVAELALKFRQKFGRDVVVDMMCYRRHGHNEGDEPAFTQPVLYRQIADRAPVRKLYTQRLIADGILTSEEANQQAEQLKQRLQTVFEQVKTQPAKKQTEAFQGLWKGLGEPFSFTEVDTAVAAHELQSIAAGLCRVPQDFHLNPKVGRQLQKRLAAVADNGDIDWGFAELLSFGSLLVQGHPVRLSGQDSGRGTFSHRHAVWQDMENQQPHKPLNHLKPEQAHFCVYNSSLSEASVLGFDYGYSLSEPRMLILWEAQFGDFANGAQVIIDQFIGAAQDKWQRTSGLVMLLPHGYEGQGPEHSNAYLERYLAACANNNIQVCNVTTPVQYFHLLRRQMLRPFRRPLVIMSPKSLLRHKLVVSPLSDFSSGGFREVLDDTESGDQVRKVILCSGKVYYDLLQHRQAQQIDDVALIRLEQFYPLHGELLQHVVGRFSSSAQVLWVQEEPKNRGGWTFVGPRLRRLLHRDVNYIGRPASASPATGSLRQHRREQEALVKEALA